MSQEIHFIDDHLKAVAVAAVKAEMTRYVLLNSQHVPELLRVERQFLDQLLAAFANFEPFDYKPDAQGEPASVRPPMNKA